MAQSWAITNSVPSRGSDWVLSYNLRHDGHETSPQAEPESPDWIIAPGEIAFNAAFANLAYSEEFEPYSEFAEVIASSPTLDRDDLVASTSSWIEAERLSRSSDLQRESRWAIGWIFTTMGIIVGLVVSVLSVPDNTLRLVLVVLALLAFMVSLFPIVWLIEVRTRKSDLDEAIHTDAVAELATTLAPRFALAARDELAALGVLQFPQSAPRLVELGSASVVTSKSIERVGRFIEGHETSTVGISGPRGVGKTTLINGLAGRVRERGGLAVVHSAPVEYSPTDFLQSIVIALLDEVETGPWKRLRRSRARRRWFLLSTLTLAVGTLILLGALMPAVAVGVGIFLIAAWPYFFAGGILLLGTAFLIRAIWRPIRKTSNDDPTALLRRLVDELENEATRSEYLGGRGWGIAEFRISRERSRRPLTHADIVKGLRNALRAFTGSEGSLPVMVAIDELDKLPNADAAIRVVNVLKDLHRIPGVHFIVTVSDEARATFGLFGPERDGGFKRLLQQELLDQFDRLSER